MSDLQVGEVLNGAGEKPKLRGEYFYVPLEVAQTPTNGECLCARWWAVHPEKGVCFYFQPFGFARSEEPSPQCNSDERTSRHLNARLGRDDHDVVFLPVVFLAHAQRAMAARRASLRSAALPLAGQG